MTSREELAVFNQYFNQRIAFSRRLLSYLTRPVTGLMLTVGLTLAGTLSLQVYAMTPPSPSTVLSDASLDYAADSGDRVGSRESVTLSSPRSSASFPGNGIYLYGQTSEPNQVGYAYAVMEVIDNRTVGAFYMPQSSFDCFHGEVQSNALELSVLPTYGGESYAYSVPLQRATTLTAVSTASADSTAVQLSGYHEIDVVSDNDRRILNVCRSALQNQ